MKEYIFDGAFGSYYYSLYSDGISAEDAVLLAPDRVRKIHTDYINAGSNAIITDSFRVDLTHTDRSKASSIIRSSFRIAKEAADGKADVFADIGRIKASEDDGSVSEKYLFTVKEFIKAGADKFIFETLDEFSSVADSVGYIKSVLPSSEIFVSFACYPDGTTASGFDVSYLFGEAAKAGATRVGLNCISGPANILNIVKSVKNPPLPLVIRPNAGYPTVVEGRRVYIDNPEYFASKLAEIKALGVSAVGGCCGTTPEHIKAACIKISGKSFSPSEIGRKKVAVKKKYVNDIFASGRKTVFAEISPPFDSDDSFAISAAKEYTDAGADVITVTDSPLSQARADSFIIASKIASETGTVVMPHLTCRDKNIIAIKASLIGGSCVGIKAVLAVTGDIPGEENCKGVFNFNSFRLISYINSLNAATLNETPYTVGAALNVNAKNFQNEMERAMKKEECGANVFLTQAIFSETAIDNLITARKYLHGKIIAGIMPLAGYKNALFMMNEVSGSGIPEELVKSLDGKNREESRKIIIDFCKKTVKKCSPYCDGFQFFTAIKRSDLVCEMIKFVKESED